MREDNSSRNGLFSALALLAVTIAISALLLRPVPAAETAYLPSPTPNPTASPGVLLNGQFYSPSTRTLFLPGNDIGPEELRQALALLPALERVEMPDAKFRCADQLTLAADYPDIAFVWPVAMPGGHVLSTVSEISLAGKNLGGSAPDDIAERAALFPNLRRLDLTGCGLDSRDLHALDEALPDTDVVWTFDLYGVEVCSTDEEIDLSGRVMKDKGALVEEALPWFSHLKKVVMCDCGISDEDMDALNQRHEDVRFVWKVNIQWAAIRTDADFFIPYKQSGVEQTGKLAGLKALKYCPDLIALDIGHSHTQDLSYLNVMPHLKYLILAENYTVDITPVGTLKELEWLEMFQCVVRDLSPLVNCTSLRDLNICYMVCPRDNVYETLRQMTWLRRLWCSGSTLSKAQVASLREELPNTEIWCKMGDESTGGTWRFDVDYYDMRDAFHMYYMDITGSRTRRLTDEELQAMHDKFWK